MRRKSNSLRVTLAVVATMFGEAANVHSAEGWTPRSRPDRAFGQEWEFVGCDRGFIDGNAFGPIDGYLCHWQRQSDDMVGVVREERYTKSGAFLGAYEGTQDGAEEYRIIFFDHGRAYFRLSESSGRDHLRVAEVALHGTVTARYVSMWERVIVDHDGQLASVPMDIRRLWGQPFPLIETFHTRKDERMIRTLRRDGVDLSQPQPVEFGFFFEADHQATATAGLMDLGCRWLTIQDRNGTIGPFPGHCAMTTSLDASNLAEWHKRFTLFAQQNEGRYYGWTTVSLRPKRRASRGAGRRGRWAAEIPPSPSDGSTARTRWPWTTFFLLTS